MRFTELPRCDHELVVLRPLRATPSPRLRLAIALRSSDELIGTAGFHAVSPETGAPRSLERCGFQREGLLRSCRKVRGRPGNFFMYSYLAGEQP